MTQSTLKTAEARKLNCLKCNRRIDFEELSELEKSMYEISTMQTTCAQCMDRIYNSHLKDKALETLVVSLDLAKKLKELRVTQRSLFRWQPQPVNHFIEFQPSSDFGTDEYAAFTVSELAEILPTWIKNPHRQIIKWWKCKDQYACQYEDDFHLMGPQVDSEVIWESSLANAMAKMLIHLLENNLFKFY